MGQDSKFTDNAQVPHNEGEVCETEVFGRSRTLRDSPHVEGWAHIAEVLHQIIGESRR